MPPAPLFLVESPGWRAPVRLAMRGLPPLSGETIRIRAVAGLRDRHGDAHAGSLLRERAILLSCTPAELPRIFVHEVFHFVWLRLSNAVRRSYEELVKSEWMEGAGGELGWSAEWRKEVLTRRDVTGRSRRWREYCAESFCDSAAWVYSGVARHAEFTLDRRFRPGRRAWFTGMPGAGVLSI